MGIDTTRISDLVLGRLPPEESLRLLDEIERDPEASRELEARARLLAHVRDGGEFLFAGRDLIGRRFLRSKARPWWLSRPVRGYALGVAVFLLTVLFPLASYLTRGPFVEIARVDRPQYEAVLRSDGDSDINLAVRMLRSGHLKESLLLLERFCRAYPESDLKEYAHYLAGAIYLSDARESLVGLFVSYDAVRVQAGLAHLEEALRISGNPRLTEESRWLQAKAFLMLDRPADALTALELVRQLEGLRSADAADLTRRIQLRE